MGKINLIIFLKKTIWIYSLSIILLIIFLIWSIIFSELHFFDIVPISGAIYIIWFIWSNIIQNNVNKLKSLKTRRRK